MARNRIHKPPPPPPKNRGKKPRSGDDDFFDDFSKDKMDSIINWELHSKMQKPTEIKTEFDFKKEPKEKKNKIKNEVIPTKKHKNEDYRFSFIGFLRKLIFKI
jgi:hypothetical protein